MKSKHDEKVFRIKLQFTIIGALAFTICLLSKNKQTDKNKKNHYSSPFPPNHCYYNLSCSSKTSYVGDDQEYHSGCRRAGQVGHATVFEEVIRRRAEESIRHLFQGKYINMKDHINTERNTLAQTAMPKSGSKIPDLK